MKHEQFIPSINAQALKTSNQYVCWIDTMGTQNTMSESLAKSANFILKLHAVIIESAKHYNNSVTIYPVMDGAYLTSPNKKDMTCVIKRIYNNLYTIFSEEPAFDKRFIIRGAIAYGEIINGKSLTEEVTTDIEQNYKNSLLLGMPIIQAFRSESFSPPFGVFIHESARKFDDIHKMQGRTFRWWSTDIGEQIGQSIINYFEWCKYNYTLLDMDLSKIQTYIDSVKAYFIPYELHE
ncbi:MAG: hypothetical protein J6R25_05835 [Bacteroidales bacterium]|nr:hypothetical protein [Bacteroidales bacterium]